MAKVGRKRKAVGWSTLLKLGLTVNFDKNPAAHTFLFENIENEGLSEFIVGLIETHLVANSPHYADPEYQFKVIKAAREAEEEMLRRKLNARQTEGPLSIKEGTSLVSNASLVGLGKEITFSLVPDGTEGAETPRPPLTSPVHSGQVQGRVQEQVQEQVQSQVPGRVQSQVPEQVRDNFAPPAAKVDAPNPVEGSAEVKVDEGVDEKVRKGNQNVVNSLI